jgi:hypothetical protein
MTERIPPSHCRFIWLPPLPEVSLPHPLNEAQRALANFTRISTGCLDRQ